MLEGEFHYYTLFGPKLQQMYCFFLMKFIQHPDLLLFLCRLHFISSIGYICGKNDTLADSVISAGGLHELTVALAHNDQGDIKIAAAWALAKAASHGPQQAQAVAESGALLAMHAIGQIENADDKLISNCSEAASSIIGRLESMPALIALLSL